MQQEGRGASHLSSAEYDIGDCPRPNCSEPTARYWSATGNDARRGIVGHEACGWRGVETSWSGGDSVGNNAFDSHDNGAGIGSQPTG